MGRIGIYPLVPKALSPSQDCHGETHAADNTACVLSIGEQFWWVVTRHPSGRIWLMPLYAKHCTSWRAILVGSDKTLRIAFLPLRRSTLPASGKVPKPFQGGFLSRMTADESFCEYSFIIYIYIYTYW